MKVSIVIPCFNERNTIDIILSSVSAVSLPIEREIIIVDDQSTDGTRERLKEIEREKRPCVKILYHGQNKGKGAALRTGFGAATGDLVIIQDADLEYDPEDYLKILTPLIEGGADVVYGSRFVGGQSHRVLYFWHFVANKFITLFCNMASNLNLTDIEVGYKAFRRELLAQIDLKEDRFGFEPEFTIKMSWLKKRVYEVGISYSGRTYREGKKIGWKDGVRALVVIFKYGIGARCRGKS